MDLCDAASSISSAATRLLHKTLHVLTNSHYFATLDRLQHFGSWLFSVTMGTFRIYTTIMF